MEPIWSVVKRLLSVSLKNERNGINQKTDDDFKEGLYRATCTNSGFF